MSNVEQSGMWLPPGAAADHSQNRREVRPFELLAKKLRQMGFEARLRHDEAERVIEIKFVPITDRTRQAVKVAAQSSQVDALQVQAAYGVLDSPGQCALSCIEKGLEEIRQII